MRKKALDINYKLGKYGVKYCANCGYFIEDYEDIKDGLCHECKEEYND